MSRSQRGMALITVLLVLAVITILASQLIQQSRAATKQTSWVIQEAQAWQYAMGAEELAKLKLGDYVRQRNAPHPSGNTDVESTINILSPMPTLPADHGEIQLQIIDRQAKLNIAAISESEQVKSVFQRLLQSVEITQPLADSITDWQDPDQRPNGSGQEDSGYLALDTPYRTAGRAMANVSELQAIDGVDAPVYSVLSRYLATLPITTRLNINTASAEVLSALHKDLDGQQVVQQRQHQHEGFKSIEEFMLSSATAGLTLDTALLTTESTEYAVNIISRFSDHTLYLHSRLTANLETGKVRVLDRDLSARFRIETLSTDTPTEKDNQDESSSDSVF